MLKFCKLLQE